ncbi:MAG: hypothetical protein WBQ44_08470 [Rhodococcus sp. (in: high G+C Gram-positive bacteria)]
MNNRSARALVAVMAGAGALLGACAAVVWHVAVPGETDSYAARPGWFPVSVYFVIAGVLIALFVASFLVDAGLRVRTTRQHSPAGLCILLLVLGGVLGAGAASAWTRWPPQPTSAAALVPVDSWTNPVVDDYWQAPAGNRTEPLRLVIDAGPGQSTSESFVSSVYAHDDQSDFRPVIDQPWTVFPVGGVVVAGVFALSLSLGDVRLTRHQG